VINPQKNRETQWITTLPVNLFSKSITKFFILIWHAILSNNLCCTVCVALHVCNSSRTTTFCTVPSNHIHCQSYHDRCTLSKWNLLSTMGLPHRKTWLENKSTFHQQLGKEYHQWCLSYSRQYEPHISSQLRRSYRQGTQLPPGMSWWSMQCYHLRLIVSESELRG